MLKINNVEEGPPGGWYYIHPISGQRLPDLGSAGDYWTLRKLVAQHCKGNGYDPVSEMELQDAICRRMPPHANYCAHYEPGSSGDPLVERVRVTTVRQMTINEAGRFVSLIAELIARRVASGEPVFDSQEEAERRANICRLCPKNVVIDGCTGCRSLLGWVTDTVGDRRTEYDGELHGCEVCGCVNKVAVHVNVEAQRAAMPPEVAADLPSFCWKRP